MPNGPPKTPKKKSQIDQREQIASNTSDGQPSIDIAALIKAIKDEGIAYRREERREDFGKARRERITIVLITLTFLAVCYQVYEMIKVYEPIHAQAIASGKQAEASDKAAGATVRAADATAKAADAAVKQSEIATRQAENSNKAVAQSQRAWVGPRNARSDRSPELNKDFSAIIEYQNSGREPAIETTFDSDIFVATNDTSHLLEATARISKFISECKTRWTPTQATVVFPSVGGFGGGYQMTKALLGEEVDQVVVDGDKIVFLSGCFVYKSVGEIHRSSFCYYFKAQKTQPANWNICAVGNDAD